MKCLFIKKENEEKKQFKEHFELLGTEGFDVKVVL